MSLLLAMIAHAAVATTPPEAASRKSLPTLYCRNMVTGASRSGDVAICKTKAAWADWESCQGVTRFCTPAQKAESDATIQRESSAANTMEKARLKEEAQWRADQAKAAAAQKKKEKSKPPQAPASDAQEARAAQPHVKKAPTHKKKEPEYFTARPAAEKPKAGASSSK